MSTPVDTDLAVASTPSRLFVFYQDDSDRIAYSTSSDLSSWTAGTEYVATDARPGSPIAAYYVSKDPNYESKETVHVLYINSSEKLAEMVQVLGTNSWTPSPIDPVIAGAIETTSRLAAASFNDTSGWNPQGSQWAYFATDQTGKENIEEIRRTVNDQWHSETVLQQNYGDALPGSRLAVSVQSGMIRLFFQDHEYNIKEYRNTDNTWTDEGVVIDNHQVQPSTPLATSADGSHIFYVDKYKLVQDYDGGGSTAVVNYYPGTNLGAGNFDGKLVLCYKSLSPVGAIMTMLNSGMGWKQGPKILD